MFLFLMLKPVRSFVVRQRVMFLCELQMINFFFRGKLGIHRLRLFAFHEHVLLRFGHSRFDLINYLMILSISILLLNHLYCSVN